MNDVFILEEGTELTHELLLKFIDKHKVRCIRYDKLYNMYIGEHQILKQNPKANSKPDNRLIANHAKYIVDTENGFFIGIPIKIAHKNENVAKYIKDIHRRNDIDNVYAEISKLSAIFGHSYGLVYLDGVEIGVTYIDPRDGFIIYDDSIRQRAMYGVRYYDAGKGVIEGTYSDSDYITYFRIEGDKVTEYDVKENFFGKVPIVEFLENDERQGIFENVETLINAYNKAISEKANDVDYFADAYLAVLGAELSDEELSNLRDKRIINIKDGEGRNVEVKFLDKPNADETQENLINRLEKLIFQISMVANVNDEIFGNSSGIALLYKLQSMNNLAISKERKFTSGLNDVYELIGRVPNTKLGDEWVNLEYTFTRNMPANLKEQAEIVQMLNGITSNETALSVLDIVKDPRLEIEKKEAEFESMFPSGELRVFEDGQ